MFTEIIRQSLAYFPSVQAASKFVDILCTCLIAKFETESKLLPRTVVYYALGVWEIISVVK